MMTTRGLVAALLLARCGQERITYGPVPIDTTSTEPPTTSVAFAAVSSGYVHGCGLTTIGEAYCWGSSSDGALGNTESPDHWPMPMSVTGGLRFSTVSAATEFTCALSDGGIGYCWGDNEYGALGDGTTTSRSSPTLVSGGLHFVEISAGSFYTCGVTADQIAYCWGLNDGGTLGVGDLINRASPAVVSGGLRLIDVSAGHQHVCGLSADSTAYCWGTNAYGELGTGSPDAMVATAPLPVIGGLRFSSVSAGTHFSCGITVRKAAYCWGSNVFFQLGDGTEDNSSTPVKVAGQ